MRDRNGRRMTARWSLGAPERRALTCFVLAALAIAGGLAFVLARSEQRRSGTNGVWVQGQLPIMAGATACQGQEVLPPETVALQIPGATGTAPIVVVRDGDGELVRTDALDGYAEGLIQAPLPAAAQELAGVEVCIVFRAAGTLYSGPTPPHAEGVHVDGRPGGSSIAISYLLEGERSWWAHAATVTERVGRGRGPWSAGRAPWLIAGLTLASLALAGGVVLRTIVRGRPLAKAPLAIMAVAALNAAAWSFITPAFQVPDEVAHVAYAQSMGENGRPPSDPRSLRLSPEQALAMADAGYGAVEGPKLHASAWSASEQRRLEADLRQPASRQAELQVGELEPEPPLYYALTSLPYRVASGATLLDRIALMRLLSASLAGVTALLCFLFVRECLPGRPWAWTVGGLGVAFLPMLGFVSGGINPDALLYALAAALFLCVARGWRRGVTMRLALVLGALIAAGLLTKVNVYGLVPGTLLGFALAARRTAGVWDRRVLQLLGGCVGLAALLFAVGVGFQAFAWDRPFALGRPRAPESHVGLWDHIGYIWQVFLPKLPFQPETTLTRPGYQQVFESFLGVFGWMVVWMPRWAYQAAAVVLALTGLLAVRALLSDRRTLRWRRGEALGYLATAGVLMLMVGVFADLRRHLLHIVQGRYLLPLLALFALLLVLAARGAGERWGRAAGVTIVSLAVAWSLFCQLATVAFFYS